MFIKLLASSKVSLASSKVNFLSEVSHAIDLKAEMTSHKQILTAKQQKSLKKSIPRGKKSGRKNHRWRRRIKKKHSR